MQFFFLVSNFVVTQVGKIIIISPENLSVRKRACKHNMEFVCNFKRGITNNPVILRDSVPLIKLISG